MTLRLGALQDALMNPGNRELALKAAEELADVVNARHELKGEIADVRRDLTIVKWMVGTVVAIVLGNLSLSFNILSRLPR